MPVAAWSWFTGVGAILRFFVGFLLSSSSDSLIPPVSLLPSMLPLTELVALMVDMGVIGGVERGNTPVDGFAAATLGTVPSVGVGLLAMIPTDVCMNELCVAIEDAEFDRVGLVGPGADPVVIEALDATGAFATAGVDAAVGVGTGEGWAELETEIAKDG